MKTRDDVIKALECCFQYECCLGCPYYSPAAPEDPRCVKLMGRDALLHLVKEGGKK